MLHHFMIDTDRELISFSFSLLNEVDEKIQRRILFYENQVLNYVQKKIEHFIQTLNISKAMQCICQAELYTLIQARLKKLIARHSLFKSC
ncbi:hypothetical protein CEF21_13285 [Bacillus sp. FJAT-42376]|uniref:hypothetical protein n=1 Tax=Bacillus sp. FJAT-42376 TaxID=2014076 RepID=UPI000F4F1214|nr:hypothetical protein [Bacillus sp. FJAT-42376]AZB43196.1 hypothetical protein CEF21_13285 [Bacillus sp. FJAT-42376]